ncbi:MAG: response regulator transcription factor [Lachnospiraceae bacterium]|nr:response regulator transcription factor [Lachnospiraceae bacterium]
MANVLILEDSADTAAALERIIKAIQEQVDVFSFSTYPEAKKALESDIRFDFFFLDINLEEGTSDTSGLTFAKEIRKQERYEFTPIIFLTSIAEMELMSFRETQCYKYLIKPFQTDEIYALAKKLLSHYKMEEEPQITVKKDGINYRINIKEIVYISAVPRGVNIRLRDDEITIKYLTLTQLMKRLPEGMFLQCHRMFVINRDYIEYVDMVNQVVKMTGCDERIEIGVTYKQEMRKMIHG